MEYRHVRDVCLVPTSEEMVMWLLKHGVEDAAEEGMCISVSRDHLIT